MASVWLAVDERLGRQIALKVLSDELAEYRELRNRFIQESKAAARVEHPNIIPVYSAGESDGRHYIAMRHVNGGDVGALLTRQGPLPLSQAVAVIRAVASALDAAHAADLTHGDVKPGNMLLHSRGDDDLEVFLSDFGIASFSGSPVSRGEFTLGTRGFMAPEVLLGDAAGRQSDQWALACSAFAMLSGSNPFVAMSGDELLHVLMTRMPSLTAYRPELAPAMGEVLARAMHQEPGCRFPSCLEFALALRDASSHAPGPIDAREPNVIPLQPGFRYVQEPYREASAGFGSLGHDDLVTDLVKRIVHSAGGTFLITGFRGVGKSSLVLRALDELTARAGDTELVVPVEMSVARSTTTQELLFAVIRRVYEALQDRRVLERLPPQARRELGIAYTRTQVTLKETRADSQQGAIGVGAGRGPTFTATRSKSDAVEGSFLPYSEGDAEHALMRIIAMIGGKPVPERPRRGRLRWRRPATQPPRLRLVIVLDEVDKLTADDAGMATVEDLLRGTRNLLTMSGAHFLLVAGPDLHDRASRDARRGHEIHRSVFGWQLYVPCTWDAPRRLISEVSVGSAGGDLELLASYLSFKARGKLRLLLQEVNDFVTWTDDDQPQLRMPGQVAFYAKLEQFIQEFVAERRRTNLLSDPLTADRRRLGSYYAAEWVLRSDGMPFTAAELLQDGGEAQFDPLLGVSREIVDLLLDHFARCGILQVVRGEQDPGGTVISDVVGAADKVYRLSGEILAEMHGLAGGRELAPLPTAEAGVSLPDPYQEAMSAGTVLVHKTPAIAAAEPTNFEPREYPGTKRIIGRKYALDRPLSQGALGATYRAHEIRTRRQVSVKVLRRELVGDDVARARFRREAEMLRRLEHPHVVRTLETLGTPDPYAIVMEPLVGSTLEGVVRDDGPLPAREVAAVGKILAEALEYIAAERIARLDLKPANIVMADRGPVIASLGIAFSMDRTEKETLSNSSQAAVIGTPAFMAPEVAMGGTPDPRADIYALGLVMYFCLAGELPWQGLTGIAEVLRAITRSRIDATGLSASPELCGVIECATSKNVDDRFSDAGALREALMATPEWRSLSDG